MDRLKVVGIAGGVASGKSVVSESLQRLGGIHVDVDKLGHQVLEEPEVRDAIRRVWGDGVFDDRGHVCRKVLAKRVFGDSAESREELRQLESITHPRIEQLLRGRLAEVARQSPGAVVLLDAPVMFKAGWDRMCDKILFVDAPVELRQRRALLRGWTVEEFEAREKSQISVEEKRNRADIVIDNSGDFSQTYEQVQSFWHALSS